MYWYDIILMADEYNEMMSENKSDMNIDEKIAEHEASYKSKMNQSINIPKINMPSMPNIGSMHTGFKM